MFPERTSVAVCVDPACTARVSIEDRAILSVESIGTSNQNLSYVLLVRAQSSQSRPMKRCPSKGLPPSPYDCRSAARSEKRALARPIQFPLSSEARVVREQRRAMPARHNGDFRSVTPGRLGDF